MQAKPQIKHRLDIRKVDGADKILRAYLNVFLAHGGEVLPRNDMTDLTSLSMFVSSIAGFDCVRDCLLHQLEPWVVEDLAYTDAWLIGVFAHTNEVFRRVLRNYIDSYRSPFYAIGRSASNDRFESVFGIDAIVLKSRALRNSLELDSLEQSVTRVPIRC